MKNECESLERVTIDEQTRRNPKLLYDRGKQMI
jgi:hypothetical protein